MTEFLTKWLEAAKTKVSAKTFERYEEIVRRHLNPAFGNLLMPKLTPIQIQTYYARSLASGRLDGSGEYPAQTVLHHHRILREALHQAVKWQLLARNPADAVDPPRPERKEMKALNESETAWLLEAAQGTRLYMPILLAVITRMRRGEILAFRWRDVDLEKSVLSVTPSLEETNEGLRFKEPKTARGRRMIALPPLAVEALCAHRTQQERQKALLGPAYKNNDLVLSTTDPTSGNRSHSPHCTSNSLSGLE